jgi:hypothetical protein
MTIGISIICGIHKIASSGSTILVTNGCLIIALLIFQILKQNESDANAWSS